MITARLLRASGGPAFALGLVAVAVLVLLANLALPPDVAAARADLRRQR